MKMTLRYKPDYLAIFSNIGCENPDEFYVLMVFHKSRKGGFDEPIYVDEAQKALKRYNKKNGTQYRYISSPGQQGE